MTIKEIDENIGKLILVRFKSDRDNQIATLRIQSRRSYKGQGTTIYGDEHHDGEWIHGAWSRLDITLIGPAS